MRIFLLIFSMVLIFCGCTSQTISETTEMVEAVEEDVLQESPADKERTVNTLENENFSELIPMPDTIYFYNEGAKIIVPSDKCAEIYDLVILGFCDFIGATEMEPEPGAIESAFETGMVLELGYDDTVSGIWHNGFDELYHYDVIQIMLDCPSSKSLEGMVYGLTNGACGPFHVSSELTKQLSALQIE